MFSINTAGFGDTHFIGWIPIDLYRDPRKHDIVSEDFGGSKLLTQLGHLFDQARSDVEDRDKAMRRGSDKDQQVTILFGRD